MGLGQDKPGQISTADKTIIREDIRQTNLFTEH